MLVSGRLTTKKYAQVKLDHFPKQGWKFKKCLKPPPGNKQQTIPEKKRVWQREDLDPCLFLSRCQLPVFSRDFVDCFMEYLLLSLCGLRYACALYQQNKNNSMSTKARLYYQRVTNLDPFHPPNNEESYFDKQDVWVWVMINASSFVTWICNLHLMGKTHPAPVGIHGRIRPYVLTISYHSATVRISYHISFSVGVHHTTNLPLCKSRDQSPKERPDCSQAETNTQHNNQASESWFACLSGHCKRPLVRSVGNTWWLLAQPSVL